LENITPGSLVFIPDDGVWCIRVDAGGVICLGDWRHFSPDGLLADFGDDYIVCPEWRDCFRIGYPWMDE
jgi:hypothetical protein